jgi:hypothetical protein
MPATELEKIRYAQEQAQAVIQAAQTLLAYCDRRANALGDNNDAITVGLREGKYKAARNGLVDVAQAVPTWAQLGTYTPPPIVP